jgi:hypothetical protein
MFPSDRCQAVVVVPHSKRDVSHNNVDVCKTTGSSKLGAALTKPLKVNSQLRLSEATEPAKSAPQFCCDASDETDQVRSIGNKMPGL